MDNIPIQARPIARPRSNSRRVGGSQRIAGDAHENLHPAAGSLHIVDSSFYEESNPFLATSKPNLSINRVPSKQSNADINTITSTNTTSTESIPSQSADVPTPTTVLPSSPSTSQQHIQPESRSRSKSQRSGYTIDYRKVTTEDLKQARKELKAWEASFKATHQRAATQEDIAKDDVMVKKYRTYGKIKKALAAKETKVPEKTTETSTGQTTYAEASNDSTVPRTPTKESRTYDATAGMRTPSRKQEVEFVSPRKVVSTAGFMSPSRSSKSGEDRYQFLAGISTPKSQRIKSNGPSPSKSGSSRRSMAQSPSLKSPSNLFTISEHVAENAEHSSGFPVSPTIRAAAIQRLPHSTTPSRSPRTPTSMRTNSLHLPNPFQSPTRPRTSPLFGGMNNRRQRKIPRPSAPVIADLVSSSLAMQSSQGFSADEEWNVASSSQHSAVQITPRTPEADMTGTIKNMAELMLPTQSSPSRTSTVPRTPSQQPSLTFSQTTPGSARSDVDLFVVPAGFHSHYRRRTIRSTLLMASQEEDKQFEEEFLGTHQEKNARAKVASSNDTSIQDAPLNGVVVEQGNDTDWADYNSEQDMMEQTPFGPTRKALPKKRYTQKRSTRLHKIAVAPSEKAEAAMRATKPSSRSRKAPNSAVQGSEEEDNDEEATISQEQNIRQEQTKADGADASIIDGVKEYGWGDSNKPMVKSDRSTLSTTGQNRVGSRQSTSKFGGPVADGNYVAYNLQGRGFKKGSIRGKSRFANSKFRGYGAGGPSTGRMPFDQESWRTEFDKDIEEAALAMTLADKDMLIEDDEEDEDDTPWYGNVNDVTDPYVVTLSKKYLQSHFGDIGDPDEYIEEIQLRNEYNSDEDTQNSIAEGFRVNLEHVLKKVWGYPSFREGQLDAVKRILAYESTLLVLPTGSGKSLSYQLPAYIFSRLGIPSLTLVISPMISLMYDQVKCLPPRLVGACWTSVEQSPAQFKDFMDKLTSNVIKILFISPEKLQSQSFLSLVRARRLPRISFLCVDEVHCLSEWSHNFRPAYLLLNQVLKMDLKSPCVLGLTGTATEGTKDSICAMLDIDRINGVLSGPVIRENLAMTVSMEIERETALLNLLHSPRFERMDSILIYVMKQSQADALAGFLRVRNFSAESYHAGKSALDRQRIQQRFMNSSSQKSALSGSQLSARPIGAGISTGGSGIRVLVATIAFGMGLNKSNIRSVIHYCMPKSLENYIQEIGRSGRDGARAYCHMFLNQDDYLRLRSLAYADGMDWGTVLRLIRQLFSRRGFMSSSSVQGLGGVKSKKRRGQMKDNDDENGDSDGTSTEDNGVNHPGSKKRKQNDHQALNISGSKSGIKSDRKEQNIVLSTSSILVIPPLIDNSLLRTNKYSRRKRLVVIREELVEEDFDIKKEVLATLLSYIELDPSQPIKVIGSISAKCTVKFLQTAEELSELAEKVPLVDIILKQGVMTGHNTGGSGSSFGKGRKGKAGIAGTTLSMAYCCDTMSLCQESELSFTELIQELQQWKRKKWVVYELTDPGLCVEIQKEPEECMLELRKQQEQKQKQADENVGMNMDVDSTDETIDRDGGQERNSETSEKDYDDFIRMLADRLHRKLCAVERVGVAKIDRVYELFQSVATPTWQEQKVLQTTEQDFDENEEVNNGSFDGDDGDGDESSEYDEDIDPEYIQMRLQAKAEAKARKKSVVQARCRTFNGVRGVTESEMVLRHGIQEYFARRSGEGIGGLDAEDSLFDQDESLNHDQSDRVMDKTIQLYNYEVDIVRDLQRKWRSAVEVDLKVFLNQLWHQQTAITESHNNSKMMGDSPRIVSRIFHGISSPKYPALEWSRHKYWAKYVHYDFAQLMRMADQIIKEQRRRASQLQQQQQ
ncbi:hypothetical protein BCR41DRAFT_383039 [Lobosporangium transversale]|uniref:DNA 3'-5' helicase n=1 Tax=Lobosporangium transversale TaxID=64571 RepID=A0A1Y2H0V0_9FUNG|nr:hypothetical protein BCR41DRAFT_383039 [Lobosporangium transversale]ORZ28155.1 hypothetical protein BCR41DRAFT_383039 [Lobosporangium transversale]|eukprot:XP_021885840.1 hypothetical protein BCR41DRAFT_383039 [Lobosporangium transversale]